jgi:uncharacterized protein YjbI with pentapeptide repeats
MTAPTAALAPERQTELRTLRAANEAAERPPYAWAKLNGADVAWLFAEHGWVTGDEPGPRADLRSANLARADLRGMSFRQARFEGAVLFGADLREADCFFAHFTEADLRETQWSGAQLAMARMRGVRLNGAHLAGVNLRQCWLPEADCSNAIFDNADLSLAQMDHIDLHEASLTAAKLVGAKLPDADLRAAKLAGTDLRSAHLERTLLDTTDAHGANWEGAWCDGASFAGADLRGCDLRSARLTGAQLGGAFLAGTRLGLIDLTGADLTRVADLPALSSQPTGDELAARVITDSAARNVAYTTAADALLRLRGALAATQATDAATLRQLRRRAHALRRQSVPRGTPQRIANTFGYLFVGDGDAPLRVGGWTLALVALVAVLLLTLGGSNLANSLILALSGFTTAGIGYFADHAPAGWFIVGISESLLGDLLFALFIAAIVRRGVD